MVHHNAGYLHGGRHAEAGVRSLRRIPKTEHAWNEGTIVLAPTTEQEGVKEWVCTACGMVRTRPIPKLTSGGTTAAPAASPTAAPTPTPAASTDTPAASTAAPAAETADKNGKGEKTGGKGEKPGTGETPAGPDDARKNQKGDAPEKAEKSGSSVGRVLLLTLLPLLLIAAAVVVLLLVRKKKARQD